MILRALAIAAGLAACDPGKAGVSGGDCEAVLAHLVVLERDTAAPVMCPYHRACEGSKEGPYTARCPQVLTRREALCYQHATSLSAAEACLPLARFAQRIETGERGDAEAGLDGGTGGWVRPGDRTALMLHELEQIRDATCACRDATCRVETQARFDRWMSGFAALQGDAAATDRALKLSREVDACRTGAGAGADAGITGPMASCQEYIRLIERMSTCSGVAQSTRDSLQESLPSLREAYDPTNMSVDVQEQMDASCAQGLPTLRDQLRTLGCP